MFKILIAERRVGAEKKFHSSFTEVPVKAYSLGIWDLGGRL